MKPQIARAALGVLSVGYIAVYLFVVFVAFVTGGRELLRQPGAWYAAIAPLLYVGVAGAYASRIMRWRCPPNVAIALHVATAPALIFSFLGLGLCCRSSPCSGG